MSLFNTNGGDVRFSEVSIAHQGGALVGDAIRDDVDGALDFRRKLSSRRERLAFDGIDDEPRRELIECACHLNGLDDAELMRGIREETGRDAVCPCVETPDGSGWRAGSCGVCQNEGAIRLKRVHKGSAITAVRQDRHARESTALEGTGDGQSCAVIGAICVADANDANSRCHVNIPSPVCAAPQRPTGESAIRGRAIRGMRLGSDMVGADDQLH